jgi:hypothetical protein
MSQYISDGSPQDHGICLPRKPEMFHARARMRIVRLANQQDDGDHEFVLGRAGLLFPEQFGKVERGWSHSPPQMFRYECIDAHSFKVSVRSGPY